jgi:hypothetical protein
MSRHLTAVAVIVLVPCRASGGAGDGTHQEERADCVACEIGRVVAALQGKITKGIIRNRSVCTYLCVPDIMAWRSRSAAPLR